MAGFVLSCGITPAIAQDKIKLDTSETIIWDSNPLMLVEGESDIWGSETRASLELGRETQNAALKAELAATHNQFNEASFNSNDLSLGAGIKKNTELWELSLESALDYDTTRTGEITTFGRNPRTNRRLTWRMEPDIAYSLSPRSKLALHGSWLERSYEDSAFLTDYRTTSLVPSFVHSLSPLQIVSVSFQAQRYSSLENSDQKVDSLGPSLGWQYRFRPEFSIGLSAGVLGSKFDGYPLADDSWEYNPVYSGEFEYMGQRNQSVLGLSKTRQPFANGTEANLISARIENKFSINPKWNLNMNAVYQKTEQTAGSTDDLDTAREESIALVYDATDRWDFSLSQKYRQEELTENRGEAERSIARVSLTYSFGKP
ncbi:MAG: hypothetical protein CO093_06890 [Alphaproteobacteria bacterium CG_4_9_14_3_um_filter_47_13]|nr:MAG: hypothetical protein CO093_06890 [Alphaproteobacteria bacterium CG_4_9_14_3_um_filter_47_13]